METTANAAGGSDDNSYELQITTKIDYSSPISDALTTASKLLGIDGDTSQFNTMERDDSGDFTNLVSWATEKVLLKWSPSFNINNESTWTYSDQIIIYEYFRFEAEGQSTNNTLQNYTLNDFVDGVTIDAAAIPNKGYNAVGIIENVSYAKNIKELHYYNSSIKAKLLVLDSNKILYH